MAVTNILESMWPTGDADGEGGAKYVPQSDCSVGAVAKGGGSHE
jgi:hypothetical protein